MLSSRRREVSLVCDLSGELHGVSSWQSPTEVLTVAVIGFGKGADSSCALRPLNRIEPRILPAQLPLNEMLSQIHTRVHR